MLVFAVRVPARLHRALVALPPDRIRAALAACVDVAGSGSPPALTLTAIRRSERRILASGAYGDKHDQRRQDRMHAVGAPPFERELLAHSMAVRKGLAFREAEALARGLGRPDLARRARRAWMRQEAVVRAAAAEVPKSRRRKPKAKP